MKLIKTKKLELGKYMDIRRLFKFFPNFMGYIIVGQRGDGKSTAGWNFIRKFLKKNPGHRIVFLVRLDDEIKLKKHKIAAQIGAVVRNQNQLYIDEYEEKVSKTGKTYRKLVSSEWVGEIMALNTSSKVRSGIDYVKENFDLIFWDEFMDEKGKEIPREFDALKSIIETVFRTRTDAKLICISNEVDPENSLSRGLDINMSVLQPGQIFIDTEQKFCYYRTKTSNELQDVKRESDSYRFGKKSEYNKFAFENVWKEDNQQNVVSNPDGVMKPMYNVIYAGDTFSVYKIRNAWYVSDNISNAKTYALTKADATMTGLQYSDPAFFINNVNAAIRANNIAFSSVYIKEKIAALVGRFR